MKYERVDAAKIPYQLSKMNPPSYFFRSRNKGHSKRRKREIRLLGRSESDTDPAKNFEGWTGGKLYEPFPPPQISEESSDLFPAKSTDFSNAWTRYFCTSNG